MKHKTWINLMVVLGLLVSVNGFVPGSSHPAKAAPDATILYVQPGATGMSCSAWGADACELQTALSLAAPGDEIWAAQGVYKPTHGIPYASCQEIHDADLTASDGDYLIHNGGNAFQVYCADMAGTPKEYLNLDSISNYSQYTAGGSSPGTDVRTNYSKVRLLPETLQVDISDQTFTDSSGSLMHSYITPVTSMPYSVAMDCKIFFSQTGVARVDLRETPFAIDPAETFILGGFFPAGSATFTDNRQVVSLQGGGGCGWIQPEPYIYNPINNNGGPILELEHILPERRAAFRLKSGVALYGGFTGTETSREQRDWEANLTMLSGDIGLPDDSSDNSYHVVTGSGVDATAILDGFTVSGGNADGEEFPVNSGGGMYNYNSSSPTLTNVTFSGNAAVGGGGMFNIDSSPTLSNVIFSGNTASQYGGGMYNEDSSPILNNVIFTGNTADVGGGMHNFFSSPTLTKVTFSNNSATDSGGGMYIHRGILTLTDVTFSGNTADSGGGMYSSWSSPKLTNVAFSGNFADSEGGGMFNDNSSPTLINVSFIDNNAGWGAGMSNRFSNPMLINAVIRGNTAVYDGGGIHNYWGSSPTLSNVTLESNSANKGGGMDCWDSCSPTLTNTILWGNMATTDGLQIYKPDSGTLIVSYSLVEDGCPTGVTCDHLLSDDPQFVDATYGNLRLQLTSPAIDAGDNSAVPAGVASDIDGFMRFVDIPMVVDTGLGEAPIVDMGACEAQMQAIYLPIAVK